MLESALGASFCIELATLPNFTYPGDLFPSANWYVEDLSSPPLELTPRNTFHPFINGLPVPNPERLKKQTLRHKSIESPDAP